jgi:iron complex outermembrane receptor protein
MATAAAWEGAAAAELLVAQAAAEGDLFGDEDLGEDDLFGDEDLGDDDLFDDADLESNDRLDTEAGSDEPPAGSSAAVDGTSGAGATAEADAGVAPESEESSADEPEELPAAGGKPTSGIEEILIQGQVSGPVLTDTDVSTTVFSAEDLIALGVEDVADVARSTPNLEIRQADTTTATFFIRGVGLSDFSSNAAGAVAIYVDGVPMNTPPIQLGQIFDVQGLQVLRGPQGTGAGRNASAGAIKISSRMPNFENSAELTMSNGSIVSRDARDAFQLDYQGALETVVVPEVVGARFSFRVRDEEPYIRNGCGNAPPLPRPRGSICGERALPTDVQLKGGLKKRLGEETAWAARGVLRIVPTDSNVDLVVIGRGSKLEQDSTVGQATPAQIQSPTVGGAAGTRTGYREPDGFREREGVSQRLQNQGLSLGDANRRANVIVSKNLVEDRPLDKNPYRGDYNVTGTTRLDTFGATVDLSTELYDGGAFRSITAFDNWERYRTADQDMTPDSLFEAVNNRDQAWQVAQELSLEGELEDHPLRWAVGGNLLAEKIKADFFLQNATVNPFTGGTKRHFEQDLFSFNVYAQFETDFWDDYFTLKAGGRYNWERKNFDIREFAFVGFSSSRDEVWQEPTGTVKLTYHWSDAIDVYWSYNHGWKSGHFNSNSTTEKPAEPETIDAHEFGLTSGWWDDRFTGRTAFFYYDYDNYQVFNFEDEPGRNPTLEIINANSAEVYGAELEIELTPLIGYVPPAIENLKVVLRGAWLQTEYLDFTDEQTAIDSAGNQSRIVADFTGNQLANAPEWSFSGNVSWEVDLGRYGALIPRWDFSWVDDVFYDPTEGRGTLDVNGIASKPPFTVGQAAYWLHDARLTYRDANSIFKVAGWCRNLADQRYKNFAFDASRFGGVVINFVGDPRTCGVEFGFSW